MDNTYPDWNLLTPWWGKKESEDKVNRVYEEQVRQLAEDYPSTADPNFEQLKDEWKNRVVDFCDLGEDRQADGWFDLAKTYASAGTGSRADDRVELIYLLHQFSALLAGRP